MGCNEKVRDLVVVSLLLDEPQPKDGHLPHSETGKGKITMWISEGRHRMKAPMNIQFSVVDDGPWN